MADLKVSRPVTKESAKTPVSAPPPGGQVNATAIYHLEIERFRGIKTLSWYPRNGLNLILGGGDVGKTTILDAIALLFNPTNFANLLAILGHNAQLS
jgi:hypothetical protein